MDSNQLKYFKVIAECQNMTKAAEALSISQSALSIMLKKLESELGCELFVRTGRKIILNSNGQRLLFHAKRILNAIDIAEEEIKQKPERALTFVFSSNLLFQALFKGIYDNGYTFLNLLETPEVKINELLEHKYADLAIVSDLFFTPQDREDEIKSLFLFEEQLVLCVPKSHPLSSRDFLTYDDIMLCELLDLYTHQLTKSWLNYLEKELSLKFKYTIAMCDAPIQGIETFNPLPYWGTSFLYMLPEAKRAPLNTSSVIPVVGPYSTRRVYLRYYRDDEGRLAEFISCVRKNIELRQSFMPAATRHDI